MAIEFDGSGSEYLSASSLIATPPISVSAWFRVSSTLNLAQRVFAMHGSGPQMHECRLNASSFTISAISQNVNSSTATTANTWNTNAWHHGLWTLGGTQRTATLDGGTTAVNTETRVPSLDTTVVAGPSQPLSGSVAELAVWNVDLHALTDSAKIKRALAKGFTPTAVHPANLIAWIRFINGDLQDVIGNFTWTVLGAPSSAAHPRIWNPRAGRLVHVPRAPSRLVSLGSIYRPAVGRIVLAG